MRWTVRIREYLTFTRKERIGLMVIVVFIVLIWIFPRAIKPKILQTAAHDTAWITAAKALEQKESESNTESINEENLNELIYDSSATRRSKNANSELFYFDPNTLTPEGWKKLGIRQKTIGVIQNYLHKGGHFYRPEDIRKIYGIRPDQYSRLEPYIKIDATDSHEFLRYEKKSKKEPISNSKLSSVDVNSADTSAFIALPGIGSKLASRIVNFRDRLGGFYSIDQVSETYGLTDSTFEKIRPLLKCENPSVKKININTATKDEMKSHPYIKWTLANAIVEYRNQHGNFSSLEDLKKIAAVTEEIFTKIKPYISTE